jgi:multiple sugar transport system substrate-binding protein
MRRGWSVGVAVVVLIAMLPACGGSDSGSDRLTWYIEPGNTATYDEIIANCNEAANGRYTIEAVRLPADASVQREQLVRRLAASDSDIDIIAMDVIWTSEFARAEWLRPWPKALAAQIEQESIPSTVDTGTYEGRLYSAPFTTNTQLLWYRKDRVERPPATWRELVDMAEALPAGENLIEVQGARYEGYTVWFNSLLESAGGAILDERGDVGLAAEPSRRALSVIRSVARSAAADPSISNMKEDETRLAFQDGRAAFMVNYPFVYAAAKEEAPEVFEQIGVAPWPRVDPAEPAHVTLGGFNLGIGAFTKQPEAAFDAANCIRSPRNQIRAAQGGLTPTRTELQTDPAVLEAYPYADLLFESIELGSVRPLNPAYNDISLAVQRTLHPPGSVEPSKVDELREKVDDAVNSRGLL